MWARSSQHRAPLPTPDVPRAPFWNSDADHPSPSSGAQSATRGGWSSVVGSVVGLLISCASLGRAVGPVKQLQQRERRKEATAAGGHRLLRRQAPERKRSYERGPVRIRPESRALPPLPHASHPAAGNDGKAQPEDGRAVDALDLDRAAVVGRNTVDDREAEPGATCLGGVERINDRSTVLRQSRATVGDLRHHRVPAKRALTVTSRSVASVASIVLPSSCTSADSTRPAARPTIAPSSARTRDTCCWRAKDRKSSSSAAAGAISLDASAMGTATGCASSRSCASLCEASVSCRFALLSGFRISCANPAPRLATACRRSSARRRARRARSSGT